MSYCKCGNKSHRPNRHGKDCAVCLKIKDKLYRQTEIGRIRSTYSHMKKRVLGKCKSYKLYKDLELLDKRTFIAWSLRDKSFQQVYKEWKESNYEHLKGPSIDRIDPNEGYTIENIRWVTVLNNISRIK